MTESLHPLLQDPLSCSGAAYILLLIAFAGLLVARLQDPLAGALLLVGAAIELIPVVLFCDAPAIAGIRPDLTLLLPGSI